MPIYEFKCRECGKILENIITKIDDSIKYTACECGHIADRIFPTKGPRFNLSYNPKKDICDWDGNTTRYWEEYNKMKSEGKKPRIPSLDGDG